MRDSTSRHFRRRDPWTSILAGSCTHRFTWHSRLGRQPLAESIFLVLRHAPSHLLHPDDNPKPADARALVHPQHVPSGDVMPRRNVLREHRNDHGANIVARLNVGPREAEDRRTCLVAVDPAGEAPVRPVREAINGLTSTWKSGLPTALGRRHEVKFNTKGKGANRIHELNPRSLRERRQCGLSRHEGPLLRLVRALTCGVASTETEVRVSRPPERWATADGSGVQRLAVLELSIRQFWSSWTGGSGSRVVLPGERLSQPPGTQTDS